MDHKVNLKAAAARVGSQVCLMGNLDPGTPAAVAKVAQQAMADAGHYGGFILGSGCEVPMDAPRDNMKAMIETAHRT